MSEVTISGLVEGGKASGGPPLGPALGPLGVNINNIISEINNKTKQFEGIKIPVKVIVDPVTKAFRIEVGMPPTSALILKELGIQSGAKTKDEIVGNLTLEQIKKIAKSKEASLYGKNEIARVKQVLGTCKSMGVKCENEDPKLVIKKLESGELKI
ncbi:MAG: 50S ribosomal protein L11 [Candidatus Marsarchaeota archaeon]|jgi:large subunit ribosomal protein L11|nr:50S ribosomal protein L11 [Candidatus Marsarchaeota archaeon]